MISKWQVKALLQIVLSHIPFGRQVNSLWSRRKVIEFMNPFGFQLSLNVIKILRKQGYNLKNKVVLEIGCGCKPVLPLIFRIAGCRKVILTDINRTITCTLLSKTIDQLLDISTVIANELGIAENFVIDKLPNISNNNLEESLEECGLEYHAPYDLRSTDYPNQSIDVIVSKSVFEHIQPNILKGILKEVHRIIKNNGVFINIIDVSDHWQHFDNNISRINFLKYNEKIWKLINSPIAYQNRLRLEDFKEMITQAGFKITYFEAKINNKVLEDLSYLPINSSFERYRTDELAQLVGRIVAIRKEL